MAQPEVTGAERVLHANHADAKIPPSVLAALVAPVFLKACLGFSACFRDFTNSISAAFQARAQALWRIPSAELASHLFYWANACVLL